MFGKILGICFLSLILAARLSAADPPFAVGDKVQVEVSPYKYDGVITEVLPGGLYAVKYQVYGKEVIKKHLQKRIKLLEKSKGKDTPEDKPEEETPEQNDKSDAPKQKPKPQGETGKKKPANDSKPAMSKEKSTGTSKQSGESSLLDEYHLWEDDTGKFKLTARFLELKAKEKIVRLEQEDKQTASIPLDKLSKESLELAQLLAALKGDDSSLTTTGSKPSSTEGRQKRVSSSATDPDSYTKLDWSGRRELQPSKSELVGYQVPESGSAKPIAKPGRYMLESIVRDKRASWLTKRKLKNLLYSQLGEETGRLFFVSEYGFETALQTIDLPSGNVSPPSILPANFDFHSAHPDGEKMLATGHWAWNANQIVLLNSSSDSIQIEQGWLLNLPGEENEFKSSHGVHFHTARFIDEDHIQVDFPIRFENHTILVELSSGKVIYDLKSDGWMQSQVTHSKDGRLFGAFVEGELYLFDSLSGRQLGWIPEHQGIEIRGSQSRAKIAFSPNQRELAIWRENHLQIWDLVENREIRFLELSPSDYVDNSLDWVDEDYLLVDESTLYHKTLNSPVWGYCGNDYHRHSPHTQVGHFLGGLFWYDMYSQDSKEHALFAIQLPDRGALEGTPAPEPPDYLTLEPGTEVAVKSATNFLDHTQLEKVRSDLINKLKAMQLKVVDESPLVFTAHVTRGEPQQTTFIKRKFGESPFGGGTEETVTSVRYISKVTLMEEGIERWFGVAFGGGAYGVYELKEGESIQSIVNRDSKPYLDYFNKAEIPTKFERKPETFGKIRGLSRLTPQGAVPEEIKPDLPETPEVNIPTLQKR